MQRVERLGTAGVSSSPPSSEFLYSACNVEQYQDGVWRPRRGLQFVHNFNTDFGGISGEGCEIVHLNAWVGGKIFLAIKYQYLSGNYRIIWGVWDEQSDTWTPIEETGSYVTLDAGTPGPWGFQQSQVIQASVWVEPDGGVGGGEFYDRDMMLFPKGIENRGIVYYVDPNTLEATALDFHAAWVAAHGGYAVACSGERASDKTDRTIRWSVYFDPLTWNAEDLTKGLAEIGEPIALIPWQQGITLIIGRKSIGEIQGIESPFSFKSTAKTPAAATPNTVCKCGDDIFFMTVGGHIVRYGLGGLTIVSESIQREIEGIGTTDGYGTMDLRDWRGWYDSRTNSYCLSGYVAQSDGLGRTYRYSLDRNRWEGYMVAMNSAYSLLGEARTEFAYVVGTSTPDVSRKLPGAPCYIAQKGKLYRWKDDLGYDYDNSGAADINCHLWTSGNNGGQVEEYAYKQCQEIVINGGGLVHCYFRYRNGEGDIWSEKDLGELQLPAKFYGGVEIYKQSSVYISFVTGDGTGDGPFVRSVEIKEIPRGGY